MNFFDSRNSMGGGNASTEGYGHLDGSSNSSGSRSGGAFDRKQEVSVNVDSNVNWNAGQTWSGQSCNNNKGPNSHESKDYSPKTIIPGIYHDDVIADANSDFNPSGESAFYDQCLHQHQQHQFAIGRDFPYRNARQMNQQQHPLREASHHFVALQTNDSSSFPEPQHLSHQPLQLQQQQQQQQHQDKYHPSRQSMTLREQEHSIDILLAKELNQLSFRERNDINEEIHGVSTLYAVEETPELISRSLEELRFEVAHNVPIYRRRAYERSQQIYQQQQQQWEHPHKNAENNKNNNKNKQHNNSAGYINNPDFLLLFLRRDLFDIRKAASRLANFMELVYELWGEIALTEKTWKSQAYLDPFELKILRSGTLQCLQGRDRAGRRILANFADNYSEKYTVQNRLRLSLYCIMAVLEDVETQKKGAVGITMWHNVSIDDFQKRGQCHKRISDSLPLRLSAIHFCLPRENNSTKTTTTSTKTRTSTKPTPHPQLLHLIKAMFVLSIGAEFRPHLRVHIGSTIECMYALQSFGILQEQIPVNTTTGNIKTKQHIKWLELKLQQEQALKENKAFNKIESPMIEDVLFGRGWPIMKHPGNVLLRNIIHSKLDQYRNEKTKSGKTTIAFSVVSMIKQKGGGGRFLKEDSGWWVEVSNDMARQKVSIAFRDARKSKSHSITINTTSNANKSKDNNRSSSTVSEGSVSQGGNGIENKPTPSSFTKRKEFYADKESSSMSCPAPHTSPSSSAPEESKQPHAVYHQLNPQEINSSTSAFLGMDGWTGVKRQRCDCLANHS